MEAWGPALKNLHRTRAFPENGGVPPSLAVWMDTCLGRGSFGMDRCSFCDLSLCGF